MALQITSVLQSVSTQCKQCVFEVLLLLLSFLLRYENVCGLYAREIEWKYIQIHTRGKKNSQPKKERDRMGVFVVGIKCMRWYTALIWILYIEHVMTIEIGMGEFSTLVVLVALRSARRKFYLFLCMCLPTKTRRFFIFNFFPVFFFGRLLHGRISRL